MLPEIASGLALAITAPTVGQIVQVLAGLMIPIGLFFVVTRRDEQRILWPDLLIAIGIFVIPTLVVLGIQGILSPEFSALFIGIVMGHVMAMLDDD